jgi:arylsulfatase A-like enzyme
MMLVMSILGLWVVNLETPHIDNLAKAGVMFTDDAHSATVCAPSRAGFDR